MNPENPFDRSRNLDVPAQLAAEMRELGEALAKEAQAYRTTGRGFGHPDPGFFYGRVAAVMEKGAFLLELALATKEPEKPVAPAANSQEGKVTPTDPKKK